MFNKDDFNNIKRMEEDVPDGIADGSEAQKIVDEVSDVLSKTNYETDAGRMEMMMNCVNLCYEEIDNELVMTEDRAFGVIVGLTFNYSNIMSNLIADGFDSEDYYQTLKNEVLKDMTEQSNSIPYWDIQEGNDGK
jgi:hypothetical protein